MIDKLHNLANTILGLDNLKDYVQTYRFIFINQYDYTVELKNSIGNVVKPVKVARDKTVEYNLPSGIYYFRCYKDNKKVYYEKLYIFNSLLGTSRTLKI